MPPNRAVDRNSIPLAGWLLAFVAAVFITLPVIALMLAIDLRELPELLTSESAVAALRLSLITAGSATVLCVVLGVPMATVLARVSFRGDSLVRAAVLLPLVLPPVVGGIALLSAFGRRGLLGSSLEALGISIAFSTVAVIIAQTFVGLPFLVLSVEAAIRSEDGEYEAVAASLGARPRRVWWTITVPRIRIALAAGAVLSFARAIGEFGATVTFAGSLQGVTRTLPLEIYLQRESNPDAAVALSVLLVVIAVVVMAVTYARPDVKWRLGRGVRLPGEIAAMEQEGLEPNQVARSATRRASTETAGVAGIGASLKVAFSDAKRDVHIEFEAQPGETLAIIGPNGSGKSTTLSVIAGHLSPENASVEVAGRDIAGVPLHQRRVTLLGQNPRLFRHLSVFRNVTYGPASDRHTRPRAREIAAACLQLTGALQWVRRFPDELSGGQGARVALARALATQPHVMLLDEPLAAIDAAAAPGIRATLESALADHTVLLVTHDLADIAAMADRVVYLEDGRVRDVGTWERVQAQNATPFIARLAYSG